MAIENMTKMLSTARRQGFAIGAFNILDYISFKAVVDAGRELNSPVIIQTSVKTVQYWGFKTLVSWYRELAGPVSVPVAMHLDHCKDINLIRKCIQNGWTSVMIDASSLPFSENIKLTKQVLRMAHPAGVSVEAELGEIGGVEDDLNVDQSSVKLADPEKAKEFVSKAGVDCFAPAIGTAHGLYKGKPEISFKNLEIIGRQTRIPLALHGGTGLSKEVFSKCISLGCSKVNISTRLKHVLIDSFVEYYNFKSQEYNPLNTFDAQYIALKEVASEYILMFKNPQKQN